MERRRLGDSDLSITRIGFGAWAIGGGGWKFGWGGQDEQDSIGAIHAALDAGMNWVDTAPIYGKGTSERVVGRALQEYGGERPYVFTKCGLIPGEGDQITNRLTAESVRREVEDSLRRLRLETIDLLQIHWPDPSDEIEEGWGEMIRQRDAGKVRYLGVSNFDVGQIERVALQERPTSLQPPYNLLDRRIEEETLTYCAERRIGVLVYSPMASGLLTGKMTRERIAAFPADDWRRMNENYRDPKLTENLALVERLRDLGRASAASPANVAVAWTLRRPEVTAAIVGFRSAEQVNEFASGMDVSLPSSQLDVL